MTEGTVQRRRVLQGLLAAGLSSCLPACSPSAFGLPDRARTTAPTEPTPIETTALPAASGDVIGSGPVRVALLLPLSGDPTLAQVGTSMANAARLAMAYIDGNAALGKNITLMVKDTRATAAEASAAASQALAEGARLILGPLRAEQVQAAGTVAQASGVPLIGFSNNPEVAQAGVYLLNVLPEAEVVRSLSFSKAAGALGFAAIFPATEFGRLQLAAYRQATAQLGLVSQAALSFGTEAEARSAVDQVAPLIKAGTVDTLFVPDRGTAPSLAVLLEAASVAPGTVKILGSSDWDNDPTIAGTAYLRGSRYPAIDDAGYTALSAEYTAAYGAPPHRFATLAYTAVVLANANSLALATPPYGAARLTQSAGFRGRDGIFRFHPDGRSDYALVMKEVIAGGARIVDVAKIG